MVKSVQRANRHFRFRLGKTAAGTHTMLLLAYGNDAVTNKAVLNGYRSSEKEGNFVLNLFPKVKRLIQYFTKKSCGV
jgi:hypothetical protein